MRPGHGRSGPRALAIAPAGLAVVSRFFVSPGVRCHGIGGALMMCAERHAAAAGRRLALDVAEHNRAAIAFYDRGG
jgi:ribosomal protein S18 acetylase RimI-like enzyme